MEPNKKWNQIKNGTKIKNKVLKWTVNKRAC